MYHRNIMAFVQAADCGSFTKAAEQYFTTAASLMKQVNSLESRVGVPLFTRTPKGLKLTLAGESLYEDAVTIIQHSEDAFNRARNKAGSLKTTLRVGSSPMNPCNRFMDVWGQIEQKYPHLILQVVPFVDLSSSSETVMASLGKDLDFVIGTRRSSIWHQGCDFIPLGINHVPCAVPRNHRLASKQMLELTDLYGEDVFFSNSGELQTRHHVLEFFTTEHPQIRPHPVDVYDLNLFNSCAQNGHLLLSTASWANVHPGLVHIPINWEFTTPYGLMYSKNPSTKMKEFVEIVKDEFGIREVDFT